MQTRIAELSDVAALVPIINAAYGVEKFFIKGDRTDGDEVTSLIKGTEGDFLVLETPDGAIAGCVYARIERGRGYLGFLSVDPAHQGKGHGRRLVEAVASYCQERGCGLLDLDVFNLRPELPPFYSSLGFESVSEAEFEKPELLLQPAHLIRMTRRLNR